MVAVPTCKVWFAGLGAPSPNLTVTVGFVSPYCDRSVTLVRMAVAARVCSCEAAVLTDDESAVACIGAMIYQTVVDRSWRTLTVLVPLITSIALTVPVSCQTYGVGDGVGVAPAELIPGLLWITSQTTSNTIKAPRRMIVV